MECVDFCAYDIGEQREVDEDDQWLHDEDILQQIQCQTRQPDVGGAWTEGHPEEKHKE